MNNILYIAIVLIAHSSLSKESDSSLNNQEKQMTYQELLKLLPKITPALAFNNSLKIIRQDIELHKLFLQKDIKNFSIINGQNNYLIHYNISPSSSRITTIIQRLIENQPTSNKQELSNSTILLQLKHLFLELYELKSIYVQFNDTSIEMELQIQNKIVKFLYEDNIWKQEAVYNQLK